MYFHIITNFTELGGAESALIRVINHSEDNEIILFSLMGKSEAMINKITHPSCKVVDLGANGSLSLLFSSFKIARYIHFLRPTKIYSWMYHANVISALGCLFSLKNIKLIWGVRHSLDDYSGEKTSTKIAIQMGKFLNFIPNKVVYCSKRAQVQHESFGYNPRVKSIYIPNGYSFNEVTPRDFDNGILILGAAGRFHTAKDYSTLFDAIKLLKDLNLKFEMHICGRGMSINNNELVSMIKHSGLSIADLTLLGEVTDMRSFYSKVDIFILSSKTEGFPNVLAESASQGCAVFSTDVGDASYIINNSMHIVPIKDAKLLASCIYGFTQKTVEVKREITASTTNYVRDKFSIEVIAKQLTRL